MKRKTIFYTFPISARGQRVSAQVRLPPDLIRLTGISVAVSPGLESALFKPDPYPPSEAGMLSIQWQQMGDVFFQTTVPYPVIYNQDSRLFKTRQLSQDQGPELWQAGKKQAPLTVIVPGKTLILQVIYEDVFNQTIGRDDLYHLHLEFFGETH